MKKRKILISIISIFLLCTAPGNYIYSSAASDSSELNWYYTPVKEKNQIPDAPKESEAFLKEYDAYFLGDTSSKTLYLTFDRIFRSTSLFAFLLLSAWLHQVPIYAIDIVKIHLAVPYDYVLKNRVDFLHGSYDFYIVTILVASE